MSLFKSLFNKGTDEPVRQFDSEDIEKSKAELIREADQGNPVSAYRLACQYLEADKDEDDNKRAIELLMLSSSERYLPALKQLGNCFYYGVGLHNSRIIAGSLYELAGDSATRKELLKKSPTMHTGVSGHFYRKLKKSNDFVEDLKQAAAEVGLYERNQFVKQGKDPMQQMKLGLAFDYVDSLEESHVYLDD